MSTVLFLVHRLPYPPNKGDKVRSYHLLMQLRERHRVLLGTFVDDAEDEAHVTHLRTLCDEVHASRLYPALASCLSLRGLARNEPLSLAYYRDRSLQDWVNRLRRSGTVDALLVFSSSMLPYSQGFSQPMVVDFADVDSDKWAEYGRTRHWPLSWVFRREGRKLQATERAGAARARWSLFATEQEAERFRAIAPESASRTAAMCNGVDSAYFSPTRDRPSPYPPHVMPVVFVGTMDYWPNVDAASWLVRSMWPQLLRKWPQLRLYIVGRRPTRLVRGLAAESVVVTGTVPDVRPYLQHARTVLAPVRLARGIQNKVLESMSMGRPVVASTRCAHALDATANVDLICAEAAEDYVREVDALLQAPARADAIGRSARRHVIARHGWAARFAALDQYMQTPADEPKAA